MILITGSAGYIGSELCKKLEESNIKYIGIDNFDYSSLENVYNKKKFIKSCISNKKNILKIVKKFQVKTIIHCAAYAYVNDSEKNKKKYYLNNVLKTKKFIDIIIKKRIKNFIFLSSSNVYAEKLKIVTFKETNQTKPKNCYGKTKLIIENYLFSRKKLFDNLIILRLFNIVGLTKKFKPKNFNRFKYQRIFFKFFYIIKNKKLMSLNFVTMKNGKKKFPSRDFLDIRDFTNLIIKILKSSKLKLKKTYNVGSGKSYSINNLLNSIQLSLKRKCNITFNKLSKKEYILTKASINKIKNEFKWKPKFLISKTIKSHSKNLIL